MIARFPSRHLSTSRGVAGLFARHLVALGLAAFLVLGSAKAGEETPSLRAQVPDAFLMDVYSIYTGRYAPEDMELGRQLLRLFVLWEPADYVQQNRAFAARQNWNADFLADFDEIIEWLRQLREGDPRQVYEESKAFRARGGDYDPYIANNLLRLAGKMGSLEARLEIKTQVPAAFLMSAYSAYTGRYAPKDVARARAELLLFVLKYSPDYVERNRAFAAGEDWNADFLADFDEIIEWLRQLRAGDPRQVYEASKTFRARGGDYDTSIADDLLRLAEKMGSLDARLERLQSWLLVDSGSRLEHTRWGIVFLAHDGFAPAQMDLASRYRDGNGFEQSAEKAYYWLLRARAGGLEVADQIEAMRGALSPEGAQRVAKWLESGFPPDP